MFSVLWFFSSQTYSLHLLQVMRAFFVPSLVCDWGISEKQKKSGFVTSKLTSTAKQLSIRAKIKQNEGCCGCLHHSVAHALSNSPRMRRHTSFVVCALSWGFYRMCSWRSVFGGMSGYATGMLSIMGGEVCYATDDAVENLRILCCVIDIIFFHLPQNWIASKTFCLRV